MAQIRDSSTLVVYQDGQHFQISAENLKEYLAPLATYDGVPGVMYPSRDFQYNELSGELAIAGVINYSYVGLVGYTSPMRIVPTGDEIPGDYYIVGDVTYKNLEPQSWGSVSGDPVEVGDQVYRQKDGDWIIIPGLATVSISTNTPDYLVITSEGPDFNIDINVSEFDNRYVQNNFLAYPEVS